MVFLVTITSDNSIDSMSTYPNEIYATVKINDKCSIQMKVDTGANTRILILQMTYRVLEFPLTSNRAAAF